ncbi:MFS transporter [Nocardia asteroides]|uniref:hypothetical protein n=1 Tax=Nocardia asteroides TaxID=1824 RepID=UPI0036599F60
MPDAPAASARPDLRAELSVFRNTQVWFSLAMTVLVFGGMFGAFMYIEPLLTRVTGFADGMVPWLLVLFGGRWADRALTRTLVALTQALGLSLVAFALVAATRAERTTPAAEPVAV